MGFFENLLKESRDSLIFLKLCTNRSQVWINFIQTGLLAVVLLNSFKAIGYDIPLGYGIGVIVVLTLVATIFFGYLEIKVFRGLQQDLIITNQENPYYDWVILNNLLTLRLIELKLNKKEIEELKKKLKNDMNNFKNHNRYLDYLDSWLE